MACDRCTELTHPVELHSPEELTRILRTIRAKIADGTLVERPAPSVETGGSIAKVPEDGPWPARVELELRCADCGTRFRLAADTVDGRAEGSWGLDGED